ncbi:MAG: phosphatidate cytidylyltransferase, partial [Alicyclobacillaceae bacterium]|nr:phosphatidate cytidylyltransferase [Alicyclobacillaceae bacterium]
LLRWIWPAGAVGDLDWWIWGSVVVFVLLPVFLGNEQTAEETAFVLLGVLYLGLLFRDFVWLRLSSENGWTVCLLILLSVWATDTAAYFVGSWIGGPKLAPALSPSKTVSGSMAGVVASVVPALVLAMSDIRPFPLYFMMLLGVIASLAGQLGDLAESAVKRAFGVKDSGQLLPGHGGILDRFDSLLLAGSVAYHLLLVLRF